MEIRMATAIKVNTAVSPSLHPELVLKLEGYDEATAPILAPVLTAFEDAYQAIGDVHVARAVAENDPSLTDAARVLKLAKMGEAHQDRVLRRFDSAYQTLGKQIKALEDQLNSPLKAAAERPGIAAEVRAHLKSMTQSERVKFVEERLRVGDAVTLQMLLGAPAYLSGLSDEMATVYSRMFNEKNYPEVAKRLKASKAAQSLLERTSALIMKEMTKAISADWPTIKRLRETNDASEQAFIVRDRTAELPV
jgi:hemoglobin-like flavoprotein